MIANNNIRSVILEIETADLSYDFTSVVLIFNMTLLILLLDPFHLQNIYLYNYQTETAIFIAATYEKTVIAVI